MPKYAGVYILDLPYAADRTFDYFIPPALSDSISIGRFVTVPFGAGNRKTLALVATLSDSSMFEASKIKPISSVCSEELFLREHLFSLALYLKEQTLCTMGDAVHAMIPASAFSRLVEYYKSTDKNGDPGGTKNPDAHRMLAFIREKKLVSDSSMRAAFGASYRKTADKLVNGGWIKRELKVKDGGKTVTKSIFSLDIDAETLNAVLSHQKGMPRVSSEGQMAALIKLSGENEGLSEDALLSNSEITKANLRALLDKGLIKEEKITVYRDPYSRLSANSAKKELKLSEEQTAAYNTLASLADSGKPQAALLHGVTGSGKTSVMTAIIDKMLKDGKGVILLLPEISLTPQTISIFKGRYGDICTVVHSSLSAGERYDSYRRISEGNARVVVGTRSAVFSPVQNLGLIIIDEEQELTYKSDRDPKYHARDAARFRCASENALLLLASATPSLESYKKAMDGKYHLIKLKNRYGGAKLPDVKITDMRDEARDGNVSPLGRELVSELAFSKESGKQSILFLNRRGYNTFVSCRSCGEALTCPSCSISLTYHTKKGTYKEGYLMCHMCGRKLAPMKICPSCGSDKLANMGYGTQRVEEELGVLLPSSRVLRMDTDTTGTKFSYDNLLGSFRKGEADILLGTQMVTKGHDFPSVSLVGVLLADMSLYLDDYRASERTFSMLTQVVGRAGRASDDGKAIIQTGNPEHDIIKLACAQDYETFYEREIKLRELLVFPPFCDIALLTLSSESERDLFSATEKLVEMYNALTGGDGEFSDVKTVVFGPFEAPIYRVEGKCRMRLVIKCRLNKRSRRLFSQLLSSFSDESAIKRSQKTGRPHLSIDFNPSSL